MANFVAAEDRVRSESSTAASEKKTSEKQTSVSIVGEDFHINGKPTYAGRTWNGHRIEGLLMNSRMVRTSMT